MITSGDMVADDSFISRLTDHVESEDFFNELMSDISNIDNAMQRAKLNLELLSYIAPKIKSQDIGKSKLNQDITITFTDAVDPKEVVEDDNTSTESAEEVPAIKD